MDTFTEDLPSALKMRYKFMVVRYHTAIENGNRRELEVLFASSARDTSLPWGHQTVESIVCFGENLSTYFRELKITISALKAEGDSVICESVFSGIVDNVSRSILCKESFYIATWYGVKDSFQCRNAEYSWPLPFREILHLNQLANA